MSFCYKFIAFLLSDLQRNIVTPLASLLILPGVGSAGLPVPKFQIPMLEEVQHYEHSSAL